MTLIKSLAMLMTLAVLGACSAPVSPASGPDDPDRSKTVNADPALEALADDQALFKIVDIDITVPRSLEVSERNSYYPGADIVWRGDPIGDRYEQIEAIFETAFARGAKSLQGATPVAIDVEVVRFHALTEKARYTIGGVHAITFDLQLHDPVSGQLWGAPRRVQADLDAFGGMQALRAEQRGETQKVRITNHLAEVLRQEMSRPDGHQNAQLGLIQAINKL